MRYDATVLLNVSLVGCWRCGRSELRRQPTNTGTGVRCCRVNPLPLSGLDSWGVLVVLLPFWGQVFFLTALEEFAL